MGIWSTEVGETLKLEKYRENKSRAMRGGKKKIGTYDNRSILVTKLFVLALGVGGRAERR